ncbi:hypothetical protein [Psychromarinibacter sediminicola]|uniref:hypothetical protein n=1 Tax=Psychromarinibacter sediminicola TaxID=3033385 RepID=UPI0023BA8297|nr:hypothetical protein [Psychromarinibacter sediminicola]
MAHDRDVKLAIHPYEFAGRRGELAPAEGAAEKPIYLAIRGHEKTSRTVRG